MNDDLKSALFSTKPIKKPEEPAAEEDTPDVGPCAAIAKNKWVTALTIKHPDGRLESFQYGGLMVRSEYQPGAFWIKFQAHRGLVWVNSTL